MTIKDGRTVIRGGRLFCSETGLDEPGSAVFEDGKITNSGPEVVDEPSPGLDFPNDLLLPGLVDLHAHPAPESWKFGIDPDKELLPRGTTTALSQGDAGAANWPKYRESVIDASQTRIRLAISVSARGEELPGPCFENLDNLDVDACVSAIKEAGELIWGVSVNVALAACGDADPREVMRRALDAAERSGKPLLFGNRWEPYDWKISEQLSLLRPGDVVTYCFHTGPNAIVTDEGRVRDSVWKARERGVLFDVGHGMNSLNFPVAEAAISQGFLPDTISSDQYKRHVGSAPQHDLPRTISKLMAAGLPGTAAFARATARPAKVLEMSGQIRTLSPGASADITVLRWNPQPSALTDAQGQMSGHDEWSM